MAGHAASRRRSTPARRHPVLRSPDGRCDEHARPARLLHARRRAAIAARPDRRGRATPSGSGSAGSFISERFNVKEAATLSGAVGAVSTRIQIATAATNHNTRHPIVTASYATTMHRLTGGRFTLGLGRGIAPLIEGARPAADHDRADGGLRRPDAAAVARRDGPRPRRPGRAASRSCASTRTSTRTSRSRSRRSVPTRSRSAAGRSTTWCCTRSSPTRRSQRCVRTVKDAAEQAGRDPATVKVWSCFATIGDHLPEPVRLKKTVGRLATYLQAYGDLMVHDERLGPAPCSPASAPTRSSPASAARSTTRPRPTSSSTSPTLIPDEWLAPAATGSPAAVRGEGAQASSTLGADGVILHGATPAELEPIVEAYRVRDEPARSRPATCAATRATSTGRG